MILAGHHSMMGGAAPGSVEFSGLEGSNLYFEQETSQPSVFSWTGWVKTNAETTSGSFLKYGNVNGGFGIGFGESNFNSISPGEKIVAVAEGVSWHVGPVISDKTTWHHYAVIINGKTFTIYKDAASIWSVTVGTMRYDTPAGFYLGGYPVTNRNRFLAGKITRSALWSRALTASEVAADYADGGEEPSTTSGLEHFWPLSTASNYLTDSVGGATLAEGSAGVTISADLPSYQQGGGG